MPHLTQQPGEVQLGSVHHAHQPRADGLLQLTALQATATRGAVAVNARPGVSRNEDLIGVPKPSCALESMTFWQPLVQQQVIICFRNEEATYKTPCQRNKTPGRVAKQRWETETNTYFYSRS